VSAGWTLGFHSVLSLEMSLMFVADLLLFQRLFPDFGVHCILRKSDQTEECHCAAVTVPNADQRGFLTMNRPVHSASWKSLNEPCIPLCAPLETLIQLVQNMNDTQQAGRRSSRRGSGRSRRRSGGGEYNSERRTPAKKPSFWQKVLSFFSGEKKSRPAVASNGTRRPEAQQRPAPRKPEVVEVSSPKLYVGNLSFDASESDLFELFNGVGKVQNAEIVSHKYTQKSKGFAFVLMSTIDEAKRAVDELHDKDFMGRKLVVSGAKTSDVRG
jgi:hypothetical protein